VGRPLSPVGTPLRPRSPPARTGDRSALAQIGADGRTTLPATSRDCPRRLLALWDTAAGADALAIKGADETGDDELDDDELDEEDAISAGRVGERSGPPDDVALAGERRQPYALW
jgi:hypothetical protein